MNEITVCGDSVTNQSIHPGSFLSDWMLFLCAALIAAVYTLGLFLLGKQKRVWKPLNTISFFIGIALVLIAFSPNLMTQAHDSIKVHMVQHILVAMVSPIFLVLGRPVTLILMTTPAKFARTIIGILRNKLFLFLSSPLIGFALNIGGMFALYLTGLYSIALKNPLLHFVIHIHFLVAGYIFTWSIIGLDPVRVRPSFKIKIAVVFLTIACHTFLSKFMYAFNVPLTSNESASEVQEAAKLMYYWGDVSELLLLVLLFAFFYPRQHKPANKVTRPAIG